MRRLLSYFFIILSLAYIAMLWMAYSDREPVSDGIFYLSIFYVVLTLALFFMVRRRKAATA